MQNYLIRTPFWLRMLFPRRVWRIPASEKILYLTFDDGPHPQVTPYVLDLLDRYNAKAVFFCIGKNVDLYPEVYREIIRRGHAVGNHTQYHVNGWNTDDGSYLKDVAEARQRIDSDWFRPPYGRIRSRQVRLLKRQFPSMKVVMWEVLSGDFEGTKTGAWCAEQVIKNAGPGSIVVFHDSEKAWDRLQICLPAVLENFNRRGYRFEAFQDL